IPYHLKTLSFEAGDLKTAEFEGAQPTPPRAVPGRRRFRARRIRGDRRYIKDRWPSVRRFLLATRASAQSSGGGRPRPVHISPTSLSAPLSGEGSHDTLNDVRREFVLWENATIADDLTGELAPAELPSIRSVFPRLAGRSKDFVKDDVIGAALGGLGRSHA